MLTDCTKEESHCIRGNVCPDCNGLGFLKGPEGGLCVNIKCANPDCGSRFNIGPLSAQRISVPRPCKYQAEGI